MDIFYNRIIASVFPDRCCFCGKTIRHKTKLCKDCRKTAEVIKSDACTLCGMPKKRCRCRKRTHFYAGITAPFIYKGVVRHGISLWKFGSLYRSVYFFAEMIAASVNKAFPQENFDIITFIPQTEKESAKRGYNQGEILATEVGKRLNIPVMPLLVKIYDTERQHSLPYLSRSGNIFGAFDICNRDLVSNKKILLIDDIKTSGATLNECAKMLRLYEAQSVHCAVIAVADKQ